jgi:hypothetical protein
LGRVAYKGYQQVSHKFPQTFFAMYVVGFDVVEKYFLQKDCAIFGLVDKMWENVGNHR